MRIERLLSRASFLSIFLLLGIFIFKGYCSSDIGQRLREHFRFLAGNLESIANGLITTSADLDSVNLYFKNSIDKMPYIELLVRTNTSGVVINEVSPESSSHPMRNVNEQRWFTSVQETSMPYLGASRDTTGKLTLFWAWPMLRGETKKFTGALAVKIDVVRYLSELTLEDSTPVQITYQGTRLWSNSWDHVSSYTEEPVEIDELKGITIKIGDREKVEDTNPKVEISGFSSSQNRIVSFPFAANSKVLSQDRGFLIAIIVTLIIVAIIASVIFVRKWVLANLPPSDEEFDALNLIPVKKSPLRELYLKQVQSPDRETTTIPAVEEKKSDEVLAVVAQEQNSTTSKDEDTKETESDVLDLIADEPSKSYGISGITMELELDNDDEKEKLRREVYKEIHSAYSAWVIQELSSLEKRINILEKHMTNLKGDNHEFHEESKEVAQILDKLKSFQKLPNEN